MRTWRWYSKVLFALLVAGFGYWVWPTAWQYYPVGNRLVRVNRMTGRVQMTAADGEPTGWKDVYSVQARRAAVEREDAEALESLRRIH